MGQYNCIIPFLVTAYNDAFPPVTMSKAAADELTRFHWKIITT